MAKSKILFFKNGVCQGEAFTDINDGTYYPCISVFKSATVSVNFGPNFKYPPEGYDYNPVSIQEKKTRSPVQLDVHDLLDINRGKHEFRFFCYFFIPFQQNKYKIKRGLIYKNNTFVSYSKVVPMVTTNKLSQIPLILLRLFKFPKTESTNYR